MQKKILDILLNADDFISGQEISEKLGVSRQAVWKAINALKEKGYEIQSVTNRGYRLVSSPNYLNESSLKSLLHNKIIGKNLIVLDSVDSTNDYLKKLGNEGCENGTVVAAREQTKGKGRLGRTWQSKKDDGIAFSVLLRPNVAPSEVSAITPLAGLAVCKAIREYTKLDCVIKWPNDIIVGRKKLVGILTEMSAEFDAVEYVITGIGINVDHTSFPEEIAFKATSLLLETGRHVDKNEFLACVLEHIENEFVKNNLELTPTALSEYTDLCATLGRSVTFQRGTRRISGMAVGVSEHGELKVMMSDGTICLVNSGEVTVQGIY
ncbi:biotin--[acetyl-CoA-carboxylase] ligase [Ruminococcus sp.]|uniref:biotin--[acetyl-CoA-carboxylase] ligase n=1 Tax=Ruminococcus sp. TaxID=41978 RepID=UPI0025D017F1|nr:biotin--[acetyl-CoA-carboxylase] ligase [Ruminococcus sp.]MCI6615592.1 biotin--[acetyl-CoA-carboxylase] ligase [Ruminococcus sp.]